MPHIIYSQEWEPITCIELPHDVWQQALKTGGVNLKLDDLVCRVSLTPINASTRLLQTRDEEVALKLPPTWLPGQQATINQYIITLRKAHDKLKGK